MCFGQYHQLHWGDQKWDSFGDRKMGIKQIHSNQTCRYAHSRLKSTHEVTTHDTQIELMTCRHSIYMCEYTKSITNIVTMGNYTIVMSVSLLTCSASAASPPRITGTVAWSDTDTILTRWDTNSWRMNTTDGNMSRSLRWLSLYTITYRSDQLWICM